jgi:hypothetical protein
MEPLYSAPIATPFGSKRISVYHADMTVFDEPIDVLTTSAFFRSYNPTRGTLFNALYHSGIKAWELSEDPLIDLRSISNVWLSKEIPDQPMIRHIGCIEMSGYRDGDGVFVRADEDGVIRTLRAYFYMLDIAANAGTCVKTVALPMLGAGCQRFSAAMLMIPIISECVAFLKRNSIVEQICFIEKNEEKAGIMARSLAENYAVLAEQSPAVKTAYTPKAFISYSSADRNIAENLCDKLERKGFSVWIAPRNVQGPYAASIVDGIRSADHFVVILSRNSLASEHVLNEIDLAFKKLPDRIKFHPLRIDNAMFTPSFEYYLSRQHWKDAIDPPLEERLEELVEEILSSDRI